MKLSRKKFFMSFGAVIIAGTTALSNPVKLLLSNKSIGPKIKVKTNTDAVKRNSTGAVKND